MSENNDEYVRPYASSGLFGRVDIYASTDDINESNVVQIVNDAIAAHTENLMAEDYLYWYRRGITPVLHRQKEIRPEINNKISESSGIAGAIVDFKNGYFLTQPAFYVSRTGKSQNKVDKLNEYLYRSGKQLADNSVVNWFHTVGKAAIMVEINNDKEVPLRVYALDPRSAFVVRSMRPDHRPVMGINMVIVGKNVFVDAFTEKYVFRLSGGYAGTNIGHYLMPSFSATVTKVISVEKSQLGKIPIIEYRYNAVNMGAFENCISLLDAIDTAQSNRLDGIEQDVQSLIITWNCTFEDGTDSNSIRRYGMVNLKSSGDNRQDMKILTENLDQTAVQVLVDDLYDRVMTMCSMPFATDTDRSTSDSGTAVLARAGWYQADTAARNTEDLFRESNRYFDEILVDVLKRKNLLDIKLTDFELNFVRNETSNIQTKAQSFQTLLAAGLHPELAAAKSGISNDPVSDIKMSEKYMKMIWGDPDAPTEEELASGMAGNDPADSGNSDALVSSGSGAVDAPVTDGKMPDKNTGMQTGTLSRKARPVVRVEDGRRYSKASDAEQANGIAAGKVSVAAETGGKAGDYHWKYLDTRTRS